MVVRSVLAVTTLAAGEAAAVASGGHSDSFRHHFNRELRNRHSCVDVPQRISALTVQRLPE